MKSVSPLTLFNSLHACVKEFDADGQAELFAEQGIWEFPFATGAMPRRIEGRERIREFGRMGMERSRKAGRRIIRYNSITAHETRDPGVIIVEFELEGEIQAQNTRYRIPYIQLLKADAGQIVLLRDYFSMEILRGLLEADLAGDAR